MPVGHEAWMPKETKYELVWDGHLVMGLVAHQDYVLASKALKAPAKNHALIVEYLASGATALFIELAETYAIDLEQFL